MTEPTDNVAADAQYRGMAYAPPEIPHRYGAGVHLLADPLALTLLARACEKGVVQPEMRRLIVELYRLLAHVAVAAELRSVDVAVRTRMIDSTPAAVWSGPVIDREQRAVVVSLARAGLLPAEVTYDFLNHVLQPEGVRQDHLFLGRQVDERGRVTGASLGAAKIGGTVEGAVVLIPDPMGATGSTVERVLQQYEAAAVGRPRKVIALHMIVTPEYLRAMATRHPDLIVYALRLDRGLSPADVLATAPGARWEEERGLDDHHYIVPGGGGIGEVLNNSFV